MSDDWAAALRRAVWMDATAITEQDDDELVAPVPWERIGDTHAYVDVQVIAHGRSGRKLLLIDLAAGDAETEARVLAAVRQARGVGSITPPPPPTKTPANLDRPFRTPRERF